MRHLTLFVGVLFLSAGALHAETLKDVEKKISDFQNKHKSVESKTTMKLDMSSPGYSEKTESEATTILVMKGEKWLCRSESTSSGARSIQGQEQKYKAKTLTIDDGEYIYTLNDVPEGKTATKTKHQTAPVGEKMFEVLEKTSDLKLLPDETVDGKNCWAIESRPKPDKNASPEAIAATEGMRSVTWYRKSDGYMAKMIAYDKNGKPTMTMTTVDVKFDVSPKADAFKFSAPDGVQVIDMSQAGQTEQAETKQGSGGSAAQGSPEPKTEETPKEESKPKEQEKEQPKPQQKGVKGLLNKLHK